jgi:sulfatase maturation enzyme AslB (radical SAM superfamily)
MPHNGHMEITTKVGCYLFCDFCPQDMLVKAYGNNEKFMSLAKFVSYITKIPNEINIHFSGMCEPFLNDNCVDMIKYTFQKGHSVSVFTTLVGLNIDKYKELLEYDYDMFCIHVPDDAMRSKFNISNEYVNLLQYAIKNKPVSKNFWISCHGFPHQKIKHLVDMQVDNYIIDRAGNVDIQGIQKSYIPNGEFTCSAVGNSLNQNILLPNGDVLLCCMDYGMQHVLGNLNNNTYKELFEGQEAQKIRRVCRSISNEDILCKHCNRAIKF